MPAIVRKAPFTVEVLVKYSPSDGSCFPDPSAKVRTMNDKVMLSDLALYPDMIADLSEGVVAFQKGSLWGACDKDGKIVITPQFESSFEFSSGLAGVRKASKYGFIDKSARWVIKPTYDTDYTWWFVGDACPVRVGGENAVINRKGEYLWKPGLSQAEVLGGGVLISTEDGKHGFLDDSGTLIPGTKPNPRYFKGN